MTTSTTPRTAIDPERAQLRWLAIACVAILGCTAVDDGSEGVQVATSVDHLGRTWQHSPASGPYTYGEASTYCEDLELEDRDDWRLPNIDELRALIVDCPERQLGGACDVATDCMEMDCYKMADCGHCPLRDGPAGGCYWQPDLWGGSCTAQWFHWSSTPFNGLSDQFWVVRFQGGGEFDDGVVGFNEERGEGDARCVAGSSEDPLEAPAAPTASGLSTTEFCEKATGACDSVSQDECMEIVKGADKRVRPDDIPCANSSMDCDDTSACLDAVQDRNLTGEYVAPDEPTSQPASGSPDG